MTPPGPTVGPGGPKVQLCAGLKLVIVAVPAIPQPAGVVLTVGVLTVFKQLIVKGANT